MTVEPRARARLRVGLPALQKNAVRNELLLQAIKLAQPSNNPVPDPAIQAKALTELINIISLFGGFVIFDQRLDKHKTKLHLNHLVVKLSGRSTMGFSKNIKLQYIDIKEDIKTII